MPGRRGDTVTTALPSAHRVGVSDVARLVLRALGELLITAGFVVLLFAAYEVYVSNYFAHRDQVQVRTALEREWRHGRDPLRALPGGAVASLPTGQGIANLYIPRLGRDYAWTIVQGTGASALEKGPGHYPFSALPGQIGDFAIAGHRVGKGEPFLNLDRLRPGDPVVVQTRTRWYVYRVLPATGGPDSVPWRQIVDPSDGAVVAPVPGHPAMPPSARFMTMTTCHPKFTAAQRMVVHALLQRSIPGTGQSKPVGISRLYREGSS
jgi:sortase A